MPRSLRNSDFHYAHGSPSLQTAKENAAWAHSKSCGATQYNDFYRHRHLCFVPEDVRRRLAKESVNWKCPLAGKTNAELLPPLTEEELAQERQTAPPKTDDPVLNPQEVAAVAVSPEKGSVGAEVDAGVSVASTAAAPAASVAPAPAAAAVPAQMAAAPVVAPAVPTVSRRGTRSWDDGFEAARMETNLALSVPGSCPFFVRLTYGFCVCGLQVVLRSRLSPPGLDLPGKGTQKGATKVCSSIDFWV